MLNDPQNVEIATVTKAMPRVAIGDRSATYENSSTGHTLRIYHTNGKRKRHTLRLDVVKTAADPLLDGVSRQYSMSAYLFVDHPPVGFSDQEVEDITAGLVNWCVPTGTGDLTKFVRGES